MRPTDSGDVIRRPKLKIDKYNLDEDWVVQADLYCDYAEALAEAKAELDSAKDRLKVVEAEAELEVRDDPKRFRLKEPVREASIKIQVTLHPRVLKFAKILNRRRYEVGILEAYVTALEHKKRGLEKMVELEGRQYFAAPRESGTEDRERRRKKSVRSKGG